MKCRPGCAACCIVISISSPMSGMPDGKPAGVRCVHLSEDLTCTIHENENYPEVCRRFKASRQYCGYTREKAMENLAELERMTRPD